MSPAPERAGIRARIRALLRGEEGAAILEFALVLPLLVALVFGCYELGRAALVRQALEGAVRGGARTLARVADPSCVPACSAAAARALALTRDEVAENTGLGPAAIRVEPLRPAAGTVGVSVAVEFPLDLPLPGFAPTWRLGAEHREQRVAD